MNQTNPVPLNPDDPVYLPTDDQDDGRAYATLAVLAGGKNNPDDLAAVLESIALGLSSGRPVFYVNALLKSLTNGLGAQFYNKDVAQDYQIAAGQAQLRAGKINPTENGDNENGEK